MIVKVQISLATTGAERQVLVYDETRQYSTQLPLSACPGLEDVMAGAPRAYFEAEIVDTKLCLDRQLPDQGW